MRNLKCTALGGAQSYGIMDPSQYNDDMTLGQSCCYLVEHMDMSYSEWLRNES